MNVMVSIILTPDDTLDMSADEIATVVLESLNADPAKDTVVSSIQTQPESGSAGASPGLPPE
jgi:hypothetical protein